MKDVKEPNKDTLKWIYGSQLKPWADFSKFLSRDEGIYWITGKAGFG